MVCINNAFFYTYKVIKYMGYSSSIVVKKTHLALKGFQKIFNVKMIPKIFNIGNCITIVTLIIKSTKRICHYTSPVTNIPYGQHLSYFCCSTEINLYSIMQKICSCYEA